MNKTEILSIVNEPSKHIHIVKIDGKESVVYSSKFVELLELIPTMLTKADMVAMLTEILTDFDNQIEPNSTRIDCESIIEQKIQALEGKTDGNVD